jgi:predicted nucleic acid-binding protein
VNVVDSSGWLEYVAGSAGAPFFATAIEDTAALIVPVVTLYEVYKRVLVQRSASEALHVVAHMQQGRVVDLDNSIALHAAQLSVEHRLPMADSLILATARAHQAELWTQDADFEGLAGVRYRPKPGRPS